MHDASFHRSEAFVKILLDNDKILDKNPKDSHGQTPMHKAAAAGNNRIVQLVDLKGYKY